MKVNQKSVKIINSHDGNFYGCTQMIHGKQLQDKSVTAQQLDLDNFSLSQDTIIGLNDEFNNLYAQLGIDHKGNGIYVENILVPTYINTSVFPVYGRYVSLINDITILRVIINIDNKTYELTPNQLTTGYYVTLDESSMILGNVCKLTMYAIDSLGRQSNPLSFNITITDIVVDPISVKYCYKEMNTAYPKVTFMDRLYIYPNDPTQNIESLRKLEIYQIYVQIKNESNIILYDGLAEQKFNKKELEKTEFFVSNFDTFAPLNVNVLIRIRYLETNTGIWSDFSDWQTFSNINKTDANSVTLITTTSQYIMPKNGIYAIDAYGSGGGCLYSSDVKNINSGYGGCHSYKKAIEIQKDNSIDITIGAVGLICSPSYSLFVSQKITTESGRTIISIKDDVNTKFEMIVPKAPGWSTPTTVVNDYDDFINMNYHVWNGMKGNNLVSGGRDGFKYHPSIDGDKGALNDCGAGGDIRIGRGNVSTPNTTNVSARTRPGGAYDIVGSPDTVVQSGYKNRGGDGAPWGGGAGTSDIWASSTYTQMLAYPGYSAGTPSIYVSNIGSLNSEYFYPTKGSGFVTIVDLTLPEIIT